MQLVTNPFLRKIFWVVATPLLFFLSFLPRGVEVLTHNYLFLLDQGRDYMAVRNIVVNHHLTLIGSQVGWGYAGLQGIFQGPFHYCLLSIFFLLFQGDPYSGILLTFLLCLGSIALGFYFGSKVFGKIGGCIVALLIAASPPLIVDARYVWNPHSAEFFLLLAMYCIYRMYDKKLLSLFLASFFVAFTYNFELAMTAPLFLAFLLYTIFVIRPKRIEQYATILAGILAGFLPAILFEFKHHFLALHGLLIYFSHPHSVKGYGLINNVLPFIFYNTRDTFPSIISIDPLFFFLILLIPTVYFFTKESNKKIKSLLLFFFILIASNIVMFSLLRSWIYMYYFIDLNFVYIFFFVYILIRSFALRNKILFAIFTVIFIWMIGVATWSAYAITRHDLPDYGGVAKIKGKTDAVDYIYKDAHGKPFGLFIFSPDIYTDPFDYVVLWHGQQTYHYLPSQSKNGLFYLLIQSDPSKPWTYNGWEQTVIKSGNVISTVTLPSGFIVQKRVGE